ncbi:MAG: CHASE4 domain-containing protein, partial [Anaerolineaceae bacterium]
MKLSFELRSLFAIILLLGVVLGVVGWNAFRLLSDFDRLERQSVEADTLRMQKAIEEELSRVSIFAGDYAAWDDTYAYLETYDETYINTNYLPVSLDNLHIDYVLFYDAQGKLVKSVYRQPGASEIQDIPPADLAVIEAHDRYLNPPDLFSSRSGFLVLPDGPAAFASRAVVTSLLEGPIRGTLIMGRKLDRERLDSISSDLLFNTYLVDEGAPETKARFGTPSRFAGVTVLSGQRIAGVVRIPDLGNTQSFTVAFNRPRSIYASGTAATILFLGVIVIIAAAALAIMRLLRQRLARALKSEQTSAEYFRLLAKNSREMVVFATYPDLQIIEANQAVLDICGVTREEMERKRITDLGETPWDLSNPAVWERIDREGAVFEGSMWRNNAAHLPVEVAVEAADADGAKIYTLLMRGISDRVEH